MQAKNTLTGYSMNERNLLVQLSTPATKDEAVMNNGSEHSLLL